MDWLYKICTLYDCLSGWAVAAVLFCALTVFNMERYRIVRETKYSGCIPITTYFVQVRKESRLFVWVDEH